MGSEMCIRDSLSFVAHDNIAMNVEAGTTHLSNSLKELEKLHVDAVALSAGAEVTIQLGDTDLHSAITGAAGGAGELMPVFSGAPVALEMGVGDLTADVSHLTGFTETVGGLEFSGDAALLQARGITDINVDVNSLNDLVDIHGVGSATLASLHTCLLYTSPSPRDS